MRSNYVDYISYACQPFRALPVLLLLIAGCSKNNEQTQDTLFQKMDSTGISFQNTVVDQPQENSFLFRNFYNGGGVAMGDINNDQLPDVLLTSNMGENKLYLNKGNFQFEDISTRSGMQQDSMWSTGVTFADINADGWLDIYICNSGHVSTGHRRNKLYLNNRNNTFTEAAAQYGLDHSGYCTQAVFFDYDLDGDLDCFIINNSPLPFSTINYAEMRDKSIDQWNVDENLKGGGNHLFRNDKGWYKEVTAAAGLHSGLISFGLGVAVSDLNSDGWPDIYVCNDFIEKDYCYINQRNGTFRDEMENRLQSISMSSMSADAGDINNDGFPEIFTTDMIPDDDYRLKTTGTFDNIELYMAKQKAGLYHQFVKNCLQLNNGNGSFSDISNYSGVYGTDWSWGALFIDADNDGLNDLFICNGINKDLGNLDYLDFFSNEVYSTMLQTGRKPAIDEVLKHIPVQPLPNRVFRNEGQLRFKDAGVEWGLAEPGFSNSVAYGDLDGDGDLDLVVNNENQPVFVYRNRSRELNGNDYLGFSLRGKGKNPYAVGSRVLVYSGGEILSRELVPSRGFQSSVDYRLLMGMGKGRKVDSVVVIWPDRSSSRYGSLSLNKVHQLEQPAQPSGVYAFEGAVPRQRLLDSVVHSFERHTEDDYIDFYYERNLPELLSREGPALAKGDVNGDGLEDVYIGGARYQSGRLYLQRADGSWEAKRQSAFEQYMDYEEVTAVLFDADGDKDPDLFVGSGGNFTTGNSRELQHRLYLNDGRGNFSLSYESGLGNNEMNISVAVAGDYDGDGDADLFVGSRSVPLQYGVTPKSYLYCNEGGGKFRELTAKENGGVSEAGMITGAVWADVDGLKGLELVLVGAWMSPKIYRYHAGSKQLEAMQQTGLEELEGWWQSVSAGDMNGDGQMDLVLGNIGENFYLRPDKNQPVKLWLADFDGNGSREQFLTRTVGGRDMPVFLKREITDQFPGLKKQNLKHADYAKRSVQELFGDPVLGRSEQKVFRECRSIVALNGGKGHFKVSALPVEAQLSSVNAICVTDVNGDGRPDVIAGGNRFDFPPQFGRLDAGRGCVMLNEGSGRLRVLGSRESGLSLRGCVKGIVSLQTKRGRELLFALNNEAPLLMTIQKK